MTNQRLRAGLDASVPCPTVSLAADAVPTLVQLAELVGLSDPAVIHAGLAQAQGDVLVLPLDDSAAARLPRARAGATATPVSAAGWVVVRGGSEHAHTLLADGPDVRVARDELGAGQTLAVLFVGQGSVAVLAHDEHADLHIGPGVYLLRRQRRHVPAEPQSLAAYVYD